MLELAHLCYLLRIFGCQCGVCVFRAGACAGRKTTERYAWVYISVLNYCIVLWILLLCEFTGDLRQLFGKQVP